MNTKLTCLYYISKHNIKIQFIHNLGNTFNSFYCISIAILKPPSGCTTPASARLPLSPPSPLPSLLSRETYGAKVTLQINLQLGRVNERICEYIGRDYQGYPQGKLVRCESRRPIFRLFERLKPRYFATTPTHPPKYIASNSRRCGRSGEQSGMRLFCAACVKTRDRTRFVAARSVPHHSRATKNSL